MDFIEWKLDSITGGVEESQEDLDFGFYAHGGASYFFENGLVLGFEARAGRHLR